jgi:hypothetical protein
VREDLGVERIIPITYLDWELEERVREEEEGKAQGERLIH